MRKKPSSHIKVSPALREMKKGNENPLGIFPRDSLRYFHWDIILIEQICSPT